MVKNQGQAPAKPDAPKKERRVLTAAERVAKLEADLAAARAKAEKQANAKRDSAMALRAKLVTRVGELNAKIAKIDAEFPPAEPDAERDSA